MGEGRGSRIRAHSFQFYSTRSRPFHTGERKNPRDGERVSSFPGLKARPLELPAFQPVSQLHGPRFQKCIRMRRPCVYNLPDETGPALCPKMDGIIRVCATACSSPPPGAPPVGISIQIRNVATKYRPTWISFENGDRFLHGQKWLVFTVLG